MTASIASPAFLGLAVLTAVLLAALGGRVRSGVFLVLNLMFLGGVLLGPSRLLPLLGFVLAGYWLAQSAPRLPRWGYLLALSGYIAVFVYLRDYRFLHALLPEALLTSGVFAMVGLSFVFFKVVHVVIEARSGTLGELRLLSYLNYCLNFTVYTMGPIQRFQEFEAQWTGREQVAPPTFEAHLDAVLRVLIGLSKAYVLGGLLLPHALTASPDLLSIPVRELLLRITAFYFYLYLNFSGYCDVVIGLGVLLGVRPPENFDRPFLARNIADFWQRFHRSLTNWLTNYVFSPAYKWALGRRVLGRHPLLAMNAALLLTMVVSGLWHGTTASFLLFGLAHGLFFVVFRTWESVALRRLGRAGLRELRARPLARAAGVAMTFSSVALSLVFFQLDAATAFAVLGRVFGLS